MFVARTYRWADQRAVARCLLATPIKPEVIPFPIVTADQVRHALQWFPP